MSKLTECNYCTFKLIQARAKKSGSKVYQISSHGWIEIFIVPKGEKLDTRKDFKTGNYLSDQWQCSFLALTTHCCC